MNTLPPGVLQLLDTAPTLALGTTGPSGVPHVAPVFFVARAVAGGLRLYWLSSPHTRHSVAVAHSGRAAGAIYPEVRDWRSIRGLQVEGPVSLVTDAAERAAVLSAYRERFAIGDDLIELIEGAALYCLSVSTACWLDNTVAFGHKVTLTFAGGS